MRHHEHVVDRDLPAHAVPLALAEVHRAAVVGTSVRFRFPAGWVAERLADVVIGAGFAVTGGPTDAGAWTEVEVQRCRSLPDIVGPGMRVLVVGLNPSEYAADVGVPFARPGNRFWPAAQRAGIVSRDRDPRHALAAHGVGFTDLVKRATPRAAALSPDEYRTGGARVERLVAWLEPASVCFAGLSGYRTAFDRHARAGWQERVIGGRAVYVMANPSGLNAGSSLDDFVGHLRAVVAR